MDLAERKAGKVAVIGMEESRSSRSIDIRLFRALFRR
jgi:hypothetical protein